MKEEQLIFIISQPRAGSTYLQNLLSNNEEVNTCSEPWVLLNFANQIKPELVQAKFENNLAIQAFDLYKKKYKHFDFDQKQKEYLLSLYTPMIGGFRFVIDKTPRYWEIIDEIALLFPKSKIIVLKRNPLDVLKSMVRTWDLNTIEKLAPFKRDLLVAPKKLQKFCTDQKDNPNVLELTYEVLINNTSVEVEKIYNWLDVGFSKDVLDTSNNIKYKGLFGDPYQNNSKSQTPVKQKKNKTLFNTHFSSFIDGYLHFLGIEFLKSYGVYDNTGVFSRQTKVFDRFKHFNVNTKEGNNKKSSDSYFKKLFQGKIFN